MKISSELARIHAHLCGDGSVYCHSTRQKGRKMIYAAGYYNNNQKLLNKFREDFSKLFGVKMKMRINREVSIISKRIFDELTANFGDFGSRKWRIPCSIKNSTNEIKMNWLIAFFEDEAYHEKRYNRLKTKSINFEGLKDVKEMIDSMGIKCTLTGPNCDESYYLTIPGFSFIREFNGFVKEPARKKIARAGFEPCDLEVMGLAS